MPGRLIPRTWQYNPNLNAPPKYRRACRYDAFVPDSLMDMSVKLDATVAGVVSEAESAVQALNATEGPAIDPLARLLLRTESIASSRVEGMQLGVRELARAEARVDAGGKASSTAMEVLANIDAMVLAVREAALVERFDVGQIAAIHRRLMERENERIAGQIRSRQNWIGGNDHNPCGADFVPAPPEEVGRLLSDLCATINDDLLPPLVQAALVHAQFETIHPFDDGNGRTGRALVHVVLRRRNPALRYIPPISVVLAAGKPRYITALTSFRADGVEEWVEYFAATTARAAHSAKDYLFAAEALRAEWREQLAALAHAPRSDAAAWAVIDILPGTPMITASAAAKATQRSIARVYEAIEQLVEAGVLIAQSSSRRNKTWEARGLLDLIQRMESGQTLDMSGP